MKFQNRVILGQNKISHFFSKGLYLHLKGVELRLLNLAFLERAAAGLNLDALNIDPKSPIAEYLVEETRSEIKRLIEDFRL